MSFSQNFIYGAIAIAALAGFFLARYIYAKKQRSKTFTCPLKGHCHTVVHSRYSKIFGIHLEFIGMAYYGIVFLVYAGLLVKPFVTHEFVSFAVLAATACAFLFSMFLTFVQAFKLRVWCTWCLVSAGLCTLIFVLALLLTFR